MTSSPSCALGEGHGYAARGRFLIIHHLCVQDARYIRFAEFFSPGESLLFELSTEFFERPRYCRARATINFFAFFLSLSLSLFYRILFLFFLTFSISYLSITRTIRDLSRSMHAEFRIRFFQITRDRGRRTNDRGYRNILGQKEARKICPATREKELENPSLLERTKR